MHSAYAGKQCKTVTVTCRAQQTLSQSAVAPTALDVSNIVSPADVEVSFVPLDMAQLPRAISSDTLSDTQSQSCSHDSRLRDSSNQPHSEKLPAVKVPLTSMGRARVAGRVAAPQSVAEGFEPSTCSALESDDYSEYKLTVDDYLQAQPDESQEEEAAESLRQHLSSIPSWSDHISVAVPNQQSCMGVACLNPATAQHAQRASKQGSPVAPGPIAEGKESIAAFHPSWHLRLNQTAHSEAQPEQATPAISSETNDSTPLDKFYRPMAGVVKAPQPQPSMIEEAGCLNFGSHLVPNNRLPEEVGVQREKGQVRQHSALDDAALGSDEEEIEHEDETRSQPLSLAESGAAHEEDSPFRRDSVGPPRGSEAEDMPDDALEGQGHFTEGQYADYRSEEGLSEAEYYSEGHANTEGLDQSLDVLPAGITANTEVYSPMSHGATRVRSMITNRPFLLEEPVSPVAERLGHAMRLGTQVTFSSQAMTDSGAIMQVPPASQEEPLYHDWSQPSAAATAAAAAEAAAAADAAAQAEYEAQQAAVRKPLSDPNTVRAPKAGPMTRLADSLFRRSGKRTIETQTTECREEETQTLDPAESQAAAQQMVMANGGSCLADRQQCLHAFMLSLSTTALLLIGLISSHSLHGFNMYVAQQLLLIVVGNTGNSALGQELSFGDALRAQASPETHHQSSGGRGTLLSDLIEEHGPLAASAMSSPTHTTTFILPAQQTSPAQLAGLATDNSHDPVRVGSPQLNAQAVQQTAWPATDAAVAAGIAAGDLMTFQVDGQIKLGLRPRQLTFSGSAQQPPQLGPQLWAGSQALPAPATLAAPPQAAADTPLIAGHPELSPVPLLASRAASNASNAFTEAATAEATVLQSALSEPVVAHQSEQTGAAAGDLQQQGSLMPANQPSQHASVAVSEAMGKADEPQIGQQLTDVAPSMSWPAAPPPPPARQPSAVAQGPVRQISAVAAAAAPSRQNSGAVSRQNSRQQPVPQSSQATGALHQSISRQGSAVQVALSRQASAAAEAVQHSARADGVGAGPVGGPGRGLEQAWAALLPSLLAEASKQHGGGEVAVLPSALQQPNCTDAKQQTVEDILKLWAPIARPAAAGMTSLCRRSGCLADRLLAAVAQQHR